MQEGLAGMDGGCGCIQRINRYGTILGASEAAAGPEGRAGLKELRS